MAKNWNFRGYVAYLHLTADVMVAAREELATEKKQMAFMQKLVHDGYTVSFRYDSEREATICNLTGRDCSERDNVGLTMSSFASDSGNALAATYAKHVMICNEGAWPEKEEREFG